MDGSNEHLTVIVVSEETAPVRRFRVRRSLVARARWIVAVAAVLLLAGGVDYVRLRLHAVEVGRLRAESKQHQRAVEELSSQLTSLQTQFDALRDLERKIRVIADLPGAMTEARTPDGLPAGQGGAEEAEGDVGAATPGLPSPLPVGPSSPEAHAEPLGAGPFLDFDPAALARVQSKAWKLGVGMPAEVASLEDLLEGLEGKSHRLASTPSVWPTHGWVTSGFGYRISPFTARRQFHAGVDIATQFGTPIVAPARGRVAFVGRKGPLGKAVVIDHGYGIKTTFGHTAEVFVTAGQRIERGTPIAAVGSTGRSTGPHLHYSVSVRGRAVDPMNYILE